VTRRSLHLRGLGNLSRFHSLDRVGPSARAAVLVIGIHFVLSEMVSPINVEGFGEVGIELNLPPKPDVRFAAVSLADLGAG
jgi:hypothetical protein